MNYFFNSKLVIGSCLFVCLLVLCTPQSTFASDKTAWDEFKQGNLVALMRHALAPGNGDPVEFDVNDCATQRNLSEDGLIQAQRIGELFKENGVDKADIYSSQWCRCVDTGNALNLGSVQELPILNSFYQNRSTETAQTEQLTSWVVNRLDNKNTVKTELNADQQEPTPSILVTHQVNITSLTGVYPGSGEIVFVSIENGVPAVHSTLAVPF